MVTKVSKKILKKYVDETILAHMYSGLSFTSLDICNMIRDTEDVYVRYKDVACIVRKRVIHLAYVNDYKYQSSLIHIDSLKGNLTYLYHNTNFDPDSYLSRDQVTLNTIN